MDEAPARAAPSGGDILRRLCESYAVFRDCRPLAIGIHKTLRAALPELDAAGLRQALHRHTGSTRYLKAIATGEERFDLAGAVVGLITDEQKQQATEALRERFKKGAERRREQQREAERQAREAARTQQHQAKLEQLARKFNTR